MSNPTTADHFHHPVTPDDWPDCAEGASAVFGRTIVPKEEANEPLQQYVIVRLPDEGLSAEIVQQKGDTTVGPSGMDAEQAATLLAPWADFEAQTGDSGDPVPDRVADAVRRLTPIE